MKTRASLLGAVLATGAALNGCGGSSPQTGIVAEITSDLAVTSELDEVQVSVTNAAGSVVYDQSFPLDAGSGGNALPMRLGFQPQGSATTPIHIAAIGRYRTTRVVSRSATLPFVSGRVLLLPLPLLRGCTTVVCSQPAETCRENGTCAPDTVDPGSLPDYHPGSGGAGGTGAAGRGGSSGGAGRGGTGGGGGSIGGTFTTGGTGGGGATGNGGGGATGNGGGGATGNGGGGATGNGGRGGSTGGTGGTGGSTGGRGGGTAGTGGGTGGRGGGTGGGGTGGGTGGTGGGTGGTGGGGIGGGVVVPSLNNGLVGYWAFDQTGTTFPDYSGNGNTLTAPPGCWTASGHAGGALDLLAAGDFFGAATQSTASVNSITSTISIAGWIIPQAGAVRTIVSRYLGATFWKLGLSDNGALRFTAGTMVAQAPGAVGDGSMWVHVAATYDGTGARLYVGGALVAQAVFGAVSLVGGPAGGPGGFGIDVGGAYDNINAYLTENYRGRLDEFTIYNRALTSTEVDALAHGSLPMRR